MREMYATMDKRKPVSAGKRGILMAGKLPNYDPRQEMLASDFEIQHKQDTYLKDVELHHHDFYEIYYLVSGDVTYVIEGRLCRVLPGDLLLISPQELHQVSITPGMEPYERYVLWIDRTAVRRLSSGDTDLERHLDPMRPGYTNLLRLTREQRQQVRSLMEALFQEADGAGFGGDILRNALVTALLVQINRMADQHAREPDVLVHSSRLVSELVEYVNQHYRERLTLEGLAERFYVSKYHLSHEFQKHMGTGVYKYIQKKRLQIARQLLAGGEHPSTVSGLCGFADYAGFYRAFVGEYGVAPREYADSVR